MNKLLIAVYSSIPELLAGKHHHIRSTWGRDFLGKAAVMFFVGDPFQDYGRTFINRVKDEVHLPGIKDTQDATALKVRGICKWMLGKMFDYMFLVSVDNQVNAKALLNTKFWDVDYSGNVKLGRVNAGERFPYVDNKHGRYYEAVYPWADASSGFSLSREAASEITEKIPLGEDMDFFIGQTLGGEIFRGQLTAKNIDLSGISWRGNEMDGNNTNGEDGQTTGFSNTRNRNTDGVIR